MLETLWPTRESLQRTKWSGASGAVSDIFFLGLRLGKLRVEIDDGGAWEFIEEGVKTSTGKLIAADLVIKNFGYEPEAPGEMLERITGRTSLVEPIHISPRLLYMGAERNLEAAMRQGFAGQAGSYMNLYPGVTNICDYLLEVFIYFDRRPKELEAYMEKSRPFPAEMGDKTSPGTRPPRTPWPDASLVTECAGLWAAMKWVPEIEERVQASRRDMNVRASGRYSPLQFLEENERDWKVACEKMCGDPNAVPFIWGDLLAGMRQTPGLIDHMLGRAHAPAVPPPRRVQELRAAI